MRKLAGSGTAAGSTFIVRSNPPLASASYPGLPALELTGVGFRIDQYVPSFTTSDTTSEFVGGFSALTTPENADLNLPGLSWVRTVSRIWNSPTQWSITETIVLSFNASVSSTLSQTILPTPIIA
jgi:hypothetical protein